ncbi:MAG: hypothetical protein AAGF73_08380 [Actinomycetota bacterium]
MSSTTPARGPRLRSPLARAVVPVGAGLVVLVLIALFLWGMAAFLSRGDVETSDRLAPERLMVGSVQTVARIVEEDGPILFPGLDTTTGERTIVLDHESDDPTTGWVVYYAYPAGDAQSCAVDQIEGTRTFVDCNGVELDVTELSPPDSGVNPIVEDQETLYIDLAAVTTTTTTG